jgi:hypothetical protein
MIEVPQCHHHRRLMYQIQLPMGLSLTQKFELLTSNQILIDTEVNLARQYS